jgi:REP element-mobilizing transposase RayT
LQYAGALYHVTSRGNRRQAIYLDDRDRRRFLGTLATSVERCSLLCHAYCLMDNHYHLLVETPEANLAKAMSCLNGLYAQGFNRRHQRDGHLFQGRYHAKIVEKDGYLLAVSRYIVLNPVRAGFVEAPSQWPWSSYRAQAGEVVAPRHLTTDWLWRRFGGDSRSEAQRAFRRFVAAGLDADPAIEKQRFEAEVLGSEAFVAEVERRLGVRGRPVHPSAGGRPSRSRPELRDLFEGWVTVPERNARICEARRVHGYTLREIGAFLGLHPSTISRAMNGA